jgi:hypothetical protein
MKKEISKFQASKFQIHSRSDRRLVDLAFGYWLLEFSTEVES